MVETSEIFNVRKNSPNTDFEASAHDLLSASNDQILNILKSNIISPYSGVVRSATVASTFESRKSIPRQSPLFIGKCYGHFARIKRTPSLIQLYSTNAHSNISFILCYCLHTCTIRSLIQLLPLEQDTPDIYNDLSTCTTD